MILSFAVLYFWIIIMGCTVGKEEKENGGKLDGTLLPKSVVVDIDESQTTNDKPAISDKSQDVAKGDSITKQPKYKTKIDSRVTSKYEIKALIGKGSFSDVLRVDCRVTKQPFAVKVLKVRNEQEEDLLNAELSVLKTIKHRYIIHLEEVIISKECTYLVMELATGGELYDRIKSKGHLEENYSCNVTQMILEGVTYLHNHGVTHRDLKPENILFYHPGKDSKIVITDFGFSKIKTHSLHFNMTTWCGTPEYIAPELLKKDPYSSKVDMWALGVIVYVMLSGHLPFSADTTPKLFKQIMNSTYSYSKEVWDDVSEKAKDFINRLLTVDPRERYDSIQAAAHEWIGSVPPLHKQNRDNASSRKLNARRRRLSKANENIRMSSLNKDGVLNDKESEVSEEAWNNYMRNKASPLYKKQRKSEGNIVLPFSGDFYGNVLTKDTILGDNASTLSPSNIDSALATEDSNSQVSSQFGMIQIYYYNKFMTTSDPEEKRKAKEDYLNHMQGNELTLPVHLPVSIKENNNLLIPKVGSLKERKISVRDQFENIDEESEDDGVNNKSFDLSKLDRLYANQSGVGSGSVVSAGSFKSAHIPIETSNASYIEKVGVWLNGSEKEGGDGEGKFSFNQDKYKITNSEMDRLLSSRRTVSIKSNVTTSDQSHASSFNRVILPNMNPQQQHQQQQKPSQPQQRLSVNKDDHLLKLSNGDMNTHSFTSSIATDASSTAGLLPNAKSSSNSVANKAYISDVAIDLPPSESSGSFMSSTSFQPLILKPNGSVIT